MVGTHFVCLDWGLERIALASVHCGEVHEERVTWENVYGTIREIEKPEERRSRHDQEVQVTQWLDVSLWKKYEEQIQDMAGKRRA